jgi:thioesterase domain-containing protein/acyl carrier protein
VQREPRNETERRLAAIWKDVLHAGDVNVADDFFGLGGSSLRAARLSARIEKAFGVRIPLASLFTITTIEAQANLIAGTSSDAPAARKLFFLHGNYEMRVWPQIARAVQPEFAFVGLVPEPEMLSGASSVASIADALLPTLRAHQPSGPYHLAGYCIGGLVAYDMACRLREAGEDVTRVVLIDTFAQRLFWSLPEGLLVTAISSRAISREEGKRWISRVRHRVSRWQRAHERNAFKRFWDATKPNPERTAKLPDALEQPWTIGPFDLERTLFETYVPRRFDGNVTLFWTDNPSVREIEEQHAGYWRRVAPKLDVRRLVGDHRAALLEHAATNGRTLAQTFE